MRNSEEMEKQLNYIKDMNRFTAEILEQAITLFDFNLRGLIKKNQYTKETLLQDIEARIRKILPIQDNAFFLVDESSNDFYLAHKNKNLDQAYIKVEQERLINNWMFAWALKNKRAVFVSSTQKGMQIILHVMTTSSRVRGMFMGTIPSEKARNIPDVSLLLLTTTLLVCSNFLESIELYEIVNRHNLLLEKEVNKRTAQLEYQSKHDNLTGLANRDLLFQRITDLAGSRKETFFACLLIDLDRFKDINDSVGHHMGDMVLCKFAQKLQDSIRDQDLIARIGGDEFAAVLSNIDDEKDAYNIAERIQYSLEKPLLISGKYFHIDVSIGMAFFPEHTRDAADLIRKADLAMYKSKTEHKNICIYTPKDEQYSNFNISLLGEFKDALKKNQIFPLYQPQYCFQEKRIVGFEALARWQHPHHGFIPPQKFISLIEKKGLIKILTAHILEQAFQQTRIWEQRGLDLFISVNLSAFDIQDELLAANIGRLLETYQVSPQKIELEITESMLMTNPETAVHNLHNLNKMGISLALDDFGTGYSSLNYLHQFPVQKIKIDLDFIKAMQDSRQNKKIVQAIIDLGKILEKKTIAEGVENKNRIGELKKMGCNCIQGFCIGRPMPSDKAEDLLKGFKV